MHIISMSDFASSERVMEVLRSSTSMIPWATQNTYTSQFPRHKAVLAFFEPSTRTHGSFEQAALNLGLRIQQIIGTDHTSLLKNESFADMFRMLAGQGARIFVIRAKPEGTPRYVAKILSHYIGEMSIINKGPFQVINAGDGRNQHPTQTFLDLLTIQETFGRLDDFTIGITNDLRHGRTAHSLAQALAMRSGVKVVLVSPKGLEMPPQFKRGLNVISESDSLDALSDCDIVYVTRFQDERYRDNLPLKQSVDAVIPEFVIDLARLNTWNPKIRIMHPLPRVKEIGADISTDPRVVAFQQAEYGIPTRMALLALGCRDTQWEFPPTGTNADLLVETIPTSLTGERKPPKHFQPVQRGMVLDHIPPGCAHHVLQILTQLSSLTGSHPRQLVQHVKSRKCGGSKDVVLLHDTELPNVACATLHALFPDMTFNYLPGNETIEKRRFRVPDVLSHGLRCSNPSCITQIEHEADPEFHFVGSDGCPKEAVCAYCEEHLWSASNF